jgi:glutamate/tyrosine decarboxylase-like PLP-dependent enzyme
VTAARHIARAIDTSVPALYVLGSPPASVVAFASRDPKVVDVMEVGDKMSERGWHLNAIGSAGETGAEGVMGVHIAVTVSSDPAFSQRGAFD